ncbi:unnamed protein product (mitochondrion) [Plasmodiophora brassicae]|uniref:Late embryogenesis abundant protein LEA-2 subgroup domain-containing protein n=1 Tax=Plasmodiophora brassicae TaxID=37360 RepID=A0A3P3YMH1_PLABS|nr:unnamed protein product [Plasmodiophora brassicae]
MARSRARCFCCAMCIIIVLFIVGIGIYVAVNWPSTDFQSSTTVDDVAVESVSTSQVVLALAMTTVTYNPNNFDVALESGSATLLFASQQGGRYQIGDVPSLPKATLAGKQATHVSTVVPVVFDAKKVGIGALQDLFQTCLISRNGVLAFGVAIHLQVRVGIIPFTFPVNLPNKYDLLPWLSR